MREDWEYKTFGEIGSFLRGKNIQKADFVSGGLPCIHYGQIHTKFDISIDYHLSEIPQEVYDKAIIASPGDVIIAITSEDIDGSCKSVVWLGNYDIAVSAHAAILKHNMNGKFIAYYLRSNTFFTQKLKYARGFKVMEIKTKDLAKLVLPIPPKPTQLSIVSELDKLNELIQIKKEQLKDYDALAQSIFYEMFGDPVENEKGWEVKKLGKLCSKIGSGATPRGGNESYKDEGISLIRSLNVYNNEFRRKDLAYIDDEQAAALSNVTILEDDVLLNITGASVARCCIVPSDLLPARVNQHVCIIRPLDNVLVPIFLNKVLTNISYQIRLLTLARSKGATREALPKSVVDSLLVPLPPLSLQHSFAHKIEQIERQKAGVQKTITDLETLLAARMQYWFD